MERTHNEALSASPSAEAAPTRPSPTFYNVAETAALLRLDQSTMYRHLRSGRFALFATGHAPGDEKLYGAASVWEWLHRTSVIPAYVRRNYQGRLLRSRLARELDRSELVGLSYALGQAMTGVFCRKVLAAPYLMHVDRYASHFGVAFGAPRKRADLFGLGPGGWVVAEAKGRSRAMEASLRGKLVAQKRSITAIRGEAPWLALGCVASFPVPGGGMRIDAFDPEEDAEDAIELDVDLDRYMLAYYLPFLNALELGQSDEQSDEHVDVNESRFVSAGFSGFGVRLALLRTVADRVRAAAAGEVEGLYTDIRAALAEGTAREIGMSPDGTVVGTTWDQALRSSDWEDASDREG